uniref:phenylacetate--CoA ligase family protein n=1 Tax=Algoriphagus sp. TaxID=1872435 RepID=UPI0025EE9EB3
MSLKSLLLENTILRFGDFILKSSFISKLKYWRKTTSNSESELYKIQSAKLNKILKYASESSPFYKYLNIEENKNPYIWLKEFPILTKKTFKANLEHILTEKDEKRLISIMSSGSTGPPSKVFFNKEELSSNRALQILWWEWAGYEFGNSVLQTGVNMNRSLEKSIKDRLLSTRYIDAMKHEDKQILKELIHLQMNPKDHFVAYASSLYLFAKTALENKILDVKFKSVISLGEKLLPQFRETIEQAFSCKVYDTYGASEGFLIASQCKEGNYHIMSPHVLVEILDEKGVEVKPGETGRVVLTGLDNYTTPLIRYEVGDLAVKGENIKCSCGLELPILKEIIGRLTDFLITPSQKYITVQTVVRILKQFSEIDQFKVIQTGVNDFILEYVSPKSQVDIREQAIKEQFEEVFGEKLN